MSTWRFTDVVARMRAALASPLPGLDAQRLMAPLPRTGWRPTIIPEDARKAAALLLLYPRGEGAHLALTLRTSHLANHAGQVSLPGGGAEPDETLEATALREAGEEVGVNPATVVVLGALSPLHIPVSGFVLYPIVGATTEPPSFVPAEREVARVIDVPLEVLAEPHTVRLRRRMHDGRHYEVPYFFVEGEVVWGATAMVLSEFLAVLGHAPFRPAEPTDPD